MEDSGVEPPVPARADGRWMVWVGIGLVLTSWIIVAVSTAALVHGVGTALAVNPPLPVNPPHQVLNPLPAWVESSVLVGMAGAGVGPLLGAAVGFAWAVALHRWYPERWAAAVALGAGALLPLGLQVVAVVSIVGA